MKLPVPSSFALLCLQFCLQRNSNLKRSCACSHNQHRDQIPDSSSRPTMMKMSGRVTGCCVALFFALTSVTAVERLNSINDLRRINFGRDVPKHSLVLLYWFANIVDIDGDDIQLTFDPNRGDYGSHHYGNFERMLDLLPRGSGYKYYTVGNIHQVTPVELPSYVVRPPREYMGRNMDRIIIRVREQNAGWGALPRIDQVYITQHHENQRTYDPEHTYQITTNLLRQIREFSVGQDQQQLLRLRNRYGSNADDYQIRNTWGDLVGLGLLCFIVIQARYSWNQQRSWTKHSYKSNNQNNDLILILLLLLFFIVLAFLSHLGSR